MDRLGLLRHAEFRKLWIGETVSVFGSEVTYLAWSLVAIIELGAGPTEMGVLLACATAPGVVLGLVAGVWVDRLRRRPLLILLNLTEAVLLLSIPASVVLGVLSIEQLYLVSVLEGTIGAFLWPAYSAFLPNLVGRQHVTEANSKLAMSKSTANTVGPGLAGVLVQLLTAPIAIIADAISFVVAALFLTSIRAPGDITPEGNEGRDVWAEIADGFSLLVREPLLRAITGTQAILRFFQLMVVANYVLFITLLFGPAAAIVFGIVTVPGGAGAFVGSLLTARLPKRLGLGKAIVTGSLLVAVSPFFMPLATSNPIVGIAMLSMAAVVGAIGDVIATVNMDSLRQSITPDRILGRVSATSYVLTGVAMLGGSLLGGLLGSAIGIRETILIAALGHVLVFGWVVLSPLRALRAIPSPLTV